ncbi:MAG: rhodanese-like domain-containing protein [Nitrospira sp. CG24E]|nr:MAG: rhodanese-like domain-containing protein [Nitrospira sp. CG24E]
MNTRLTIFLAGLFVILTATVTAVSAHHSYLLTVQQLRTGLTKVSSPTQKGFMLIDVRSPEEHMQGFIPGTDFNIDFREMKTRHRELSAQFEDHIVVYCQSGHRSNIAAETLADLGYRHVYNVTGSMNAWLAAGLPVESGRP